MIWGKTHDAYRGSGVPGAGTGAASPIEILPRGLFSRHGNHLHRTGGATGDAVLDQPAAVSTALVLDDDDRLNGPTLNQLMCEGVITAASE